MKLLFTLAISFFSFQSFSQCSSGEGQVVILITPDNYPNESSWNLFANNVEIANGTSNSDTICVDTTACLRFEMQDSFGDGLCCAYGQGSFQVFYNNSLVASGGEFTTLSSHSFNCPQGTICENAIAIGLGDYLAPEPNTFYSFIPDSTGLYSITTCDLSACDTKLWVYNECNSAVFNDNNAGTEFYNDDNSLCGTQADIDAMLIAGQEYIIRVGLYGTTTCSGGIPFQILFDGPISGCMDPNACNYNPDATVEGECFYYPNPNCPGGPDLMILQSVVENSLEVREEFATNCMVEEGCMVGYGTRTVLAFDTHIKNIGDMDYYIGTPANNPDQFSFENCHGHAHYEGYAEYVLYTTDGQNIPIGHKNGFCVMDLECSDGGTAQYGCSNMGITKQCGDIYSRALDCQWIDITDVDTAEYILAIKVNWDQSPDALGHYESNYDNNWAQVCIRITENNGIKGFEILSDCQPFTDCAGVPYGNSQLDCEGNCGGQAKRGDLDQNLAIEDADIVLYMDHAVGNDLAVNTCNDLSSDGEISVWDAGLLSNCILNGAPNNFECTLPNSVVNQNQLVSIGDIAVFTQFDNPNIGYADLKILNPMNEVKGFELRLSGADIVGVSSLIDQQQFPNRTSFNTSSGEFAVLSLNDSVVPKFTSMTPFVRIYLENITNSVCLDTIVHVLNNDYEPVLTSIQNACVESTNSLESLVEDQILTVYPNPARNSTNLIVPAMTNETQVKLMNGQGQVVEQFIIAKGKQNATIKTAHLPAGVYMLSVENTHFKSNKRISVFH